MIKLFAFLQSLFLLCGAVNFYVYTTESPGCPKDQPCYTLNQYAQNHSIFQNYTDISLLFSRGIHELSSHTLHISGVHAVTISGSTPTGNSGKPILDIKKNDISFEKLSVLRIKNVILFGRSKGKQSIQLTNIASILFHSVKIENCFYVLAAVGDITSENNSGKQRSITMTIDFMNVESQRSHARIVARNSTLVFNISKCNITHGINGHALDVQAERRAVIVMKIQDTNISNRRDLGFRSIQISALIQSRVNITVNDTRVHGGRDGIRVNVSDNTSLILSVYNTTIENQQKKTIFVESHNDSNITVEFKKCTLFKAMGTYFRAFSGSLMTLSLIETVITGNSWKGLLAQTVKCRMIATITDCLITNNKQVGLEFEVHNQTKLFVNIKNTTISANNRGGMSVRGFEKLETQMEITNCTFKQNILYSKVNRLLTPSSLTTAALTYSTQQQGSRSYLVLKNVHFIENHDTSELPIIFQIFNSSNVTVEDCLFLNNKGTPIQAYLSNFLLSRNVIFANNTANQGGGISLIYSKMHLVNNTNITFSNNIVKVAGGAIFVQESPLYLQNKRYRYCFYQLVNGNTIREVKSLAITLTFHNNTAGYGGESIYGASLQDDCRVMQVPEIYSYDVRQIFKFTGSNSTTALSPISSDPTRVCVCDDNNQPQCSKTSYMFNQEKRYPGERFEVSLVLVGYEFGTVTGTVYASLVPTEGNKYNHKLGSGQNTQLALFSKCNVLEYSVHSHRNFETVVLSSSRYTRDEYDTMAVIENKLKRADKRPFISKEVLYFPVFINVTLESCPLGFSLSFTDSQPSCHCHETLINSSITHCEIINHTGLLYRSGRVWINASFSGNESNGVVVHNQCPYDYCKETNTSVDLRYPDTQCALDHSGILCGGCPPNLSLALGSNQCLPCSNNIHLALILFFIAAGFMLVIFIKVLDLTVAKGTINGLIFYANIVWAYQSILFPPQTKEPFLQFLKLFVAWLNLDFGIETCFSIELNAYMKTWLQFLFPIYIWMIASIIIIASHYSTRATKIFGSNSVPVLATIILLSYGKLVHTIITAIGFTKLKFPHYTSVVWSFDGNVPYFGAKHAFLLLAALVALLFFWLPFVSTLLLVPWLKRKSHLKPLHWINRWKPFYDAYYGPLKDKHHYWVGLLLIVRGVLFIIFALTSANVPAINLLLMVLISSSLLAYTTIMKLVYTDWHLSLLESVSLLNLTILGSATLYTEISGGKTEVAIYISTGFAFIQFICILLFHAWSLVKKMVPKKETEDSEPRNELEDLDNAQLLHRTESDSFTTELREPFLESRDSY